MLYNSRVLPAPVAPKYGSTISGASPGRYSIGWPWFGQKASIPDEPKSSSVGIVLSHWAAAAAGVIGEGWADAVDPAMLSAVLWETSLGWAWSIEVVAAFALAGTLLVSAPRHMPLTAFAAGLLLAGLALTGHTALHAGALGLAHRLNDAVHVLAAGAWLGSLVPLVLVLAALRQADRRAQAVVALRGFSTAGHVAVALAIVSGVLNAALVLGQIPAGDTPYEILLLAKLALVAGMTALALFNRYGLVPRLRQAPDATRRLLIVSTLAEIGLGLAAVALVATVGTLDPA